MSIEIRIPSLGAGMTEGAITEWAVPDGAEVKIGDVIYSIETEKTVMDIESTAGGILTIIGQPGETYEVGALVARID